MLSKEDLWKLRQEIPLGSLFIADYRNSFGIPETMVSDFFDGFLSFVEDEMREDHPEFIDSDFYELLPEYDTPEYLLDWYYCFAGEDPLPLPAAEQKGDCDD